MGNHFVGTCWFFFCLASAHSDPLYFFFSLSPGQSFGFPYTIFFKVLFVLHFFLSVVIGLLLIFFFLFLKFDNNFPLSFAPAYYVRACMCANVSRDCWLVGYLLTHLFDIIMGSSFIVLFLWIQCFEYLIELLHHHPHHHHQADTYSFWLMAKAVYYDCVQCTSK